MIAKKIPWDFPEILMITKFILGEQQIPWEYPEFLEKLHFPEIYRTVGTLRILTN